MEGRWFVCSECKKQVFHISSFGFNFDNPYVCDKCKEENK